MNLQRAWLCLVLALPAGAAPIAIWPASEGSFAASGSADLPRQGRFITRHIEGERGAGLKIQRMLQWQMAKLGYRYDAAAPELVVAFGFDVVRPDLNQVSAAASAFERMPRSEFAFDAAAAYEPPPADKRNFTDTRRLYLNTLIVRISRAGTGDTLWQGAVTESAWCNAPVLLAPRMLTLMFDGFPDARSATRAKQADGEREQELLNLIPAEARRDCLTVWHGRVPPR